LLESGVGLKEALYILNNYNPSLDQKEDGFYIYMVNLVRKSKKDMYGNIMFSIEVKGNIRILYSVDLKNCIVFIWGFGVSQGLLRSWLSS